MHVVEGACKGRMIEVKKAFVAPTPSNSVVDGRIEDKVLLKDAFHTAFSQNKISAKSAIICFQSASVITRELVLPDAQQQQLGGVVRYEMEQYLPAAANSYIIEYRIVENLVEDKIGKSKVRVAAIPRDIIDGYYQFFRQMKLKPAVFDIQSNAVTKIFAGGLDINGERYSTDKTVAFIDIGHENTVINVMSKGMLEFSRLAAYGGRDLNAALASFYNVSLDKAEQKKISEFRLDRVDSANDTSDGAHSLSVNIMNQLMTEIQKVFQYYINRNQGNKIEAVYLHGGGSNIKGLLE